MKHGDVLIVIISCVLHRWNKASGSVIPIFPIETIERHAMSCNTSTNFKYITTNCGVKWDNLHLSNSVDSTSMHLTWSPFMDILHIVTYLFNKLFYCHLRNIWHMQLVFDLKDYILLLSNIKYMLQKTPWYNATIQWNVSNGAFLNNYMPIEFNSVVIWQLIQICQENVVQMKKMIDMFGMSSVKSFKYQHISRYSHWARG